MGSDSSASPVGDAADYARPVAATRHVVEMAGAHGVEPEGCLSGTGLSWEDLCRPDTVIHPEHELTVIRNALARLANRPGLGMEAGSRVSLPDIGILGYALMVSPTFGDAIAVASRYVALTASYLKLSPQLTGGEAVITIDADQVPTDIRQFLIERDFAMLLRLLPRFVRPTNSPLTFRLELCGLKLPADQVEMDGLTITVCQSSRNALTLPSHLLAQPMPVADPQTAASCIRQCEQLLDQRRVRRGFSAQVRMRIIEQANDIPVMAAVAKDLGLSERTLHRRLAAEGTSYRALLDEVHAALAGELLNSGFTVEQTAHRLGYSETAAFTHAHVRWTGRPPSRRKS